MQNSVDCLVSNGGDFVVDETGDLTLATALETVQQDILFRALTAHLDYGPDPFIGANLGSYKRLQNTKRTGDYIKASMYEALVRDGRFLRNQVAVDVVPVSLKEVAVFIFIRDAIDGTEDEVYERSGVPVVTVSVDVTTGTVTAIDGASY